MNLEYKEFEKLKKYFPIFINLIEDFQESHDIPDKSMLFLLARIFSESAAISNFSRDQFQELLCILETLFENVNKILKDSEERNKK